MGRDVFKIHCSRRITSLQSEYGPFKHLKETLLAHPPKMSPALTDLLVQATAVVSVSGFLRLYSLEWIDIFHWNWDGVTSNYVPKCHRIHKTLSPSIAAHKRCRVIPIATRGLGEGGGWLYGRRFSKWSCNSLTSLSTCIRIVWRKPRDLYNKDGRLIFSLRIKWRRY